MSIQFNRAQSIAVYSIAMQSSIDAQLTILDQDNMGAIVVRSEHDGLSIEYELQTYGGFKIRNVGVH